MERINWAFERLHQWTNELTKLDQQISDYIEHKKAEEVFGELKKTREQLLDARKKCADYEAEKKTIVKAVEEKERAKYRELIAEHKEQTEGLSQTASIALETADEREAKAALQIKHAEELVRIEKEKAAKAEKRRCEAEENNRSLLKQLKTLERQVESLQETKEQLQAEILTVSNQEPAVAETAAVSKPYTNH